MNSVYEIMKAPVCICAMGIVHNDSKPDDIFICDIECLGGNVILCSFGLACHTQRVRLTNPVWQRPCVSHNTFGVHCS